MGLIRQIVSTVVAILTAFLSLGAFSAGLLEPIFGLGFVFAGLAGLCIDCDYSILWMKEVT